MYNKPSNNHISLKLFPRAIVLAFILGVWFLGSAVAEAATFSVSGTLYSSDRTTPLGSGNTIKVIVGTSTPATFSTTTNSSGVWSITGINDSGVVANTPITIWVDGAATDATTMVTGYAGSNISGVPMYASHLAVYGASTTSQVKLELFTFYDSADDVEVLYTWSNFLTANADLILVQGIVQAPKVLKLNHDYINNATFSANDSRVVMAGTSKTVDGTLTGSSAFFDMVVTGSYTMVASASTTHLTINSGGTLVAPDVLTISGNYINNGTFDNNAGAITMEGLETEMLSYLAGRDTSGSAAGTGPELVNTLVVNGNYLYLGKDANSTACSQTAGSAIGCELMVFDISSSTNPVYVAGRDASGSSAGTVSNAILSLSIAGNYLYVGHNQNFAACSQTAGLADGCEIQVYDISSSTNPIYVAGRDVSGSATGTGGLMVYSLTVAGNYLYVGKTLDATACSQTAGSAIGCELMVFDISTPTNPIYVAGRDSSGSSTGTGNQAIYSLVTAGNYLYVGKLNNSTACSQTAGSASGCELMVFDISSSTNPVYVAGRDASGNADGTGSLAVRFLAVSGNYLYVGKGASATACSQTAGSAIGCELMVFDVSSSTNPVYVAGRDASGSSTGTGSLTIYSLTTAGNYLYLGKDANATACSQTAGSALGCEIMVFNAPTGQLSGNLTGSSDLGVLNASGLITFNANASTTDFTVATGSIVTMPTDITIAGNYANAGAVDFVEAGTVFIGGGSAMTLSGTLVDASYLPNVSFIGTATTTISSPASSTYFTVQSGAKVVGNNTLEVTKYLTNKGTLTLETDLLLSGDFGKLHGYY